MAKGKICYMDCETTGLDPNEHAVIEVAMIIEDGGREVGEKVWRMRPFATDKINKDALEKNGLDRADVLAYPDPVGQWQSIEKWLGRFVKKFDKNDKLSPAGHHVGFDVNFLKALWRKADKEKKGIFYGSWFDYRTIDSGAFVNWLIMAGALNLPDYKLGTLCEHFGIELTDAHTALADADAARQLIKVLAERYLKLEMEKG